MSKKLLLSVLLTVVALLFSVFSPKYPSSQETALAQHDSAIPSEIRGGTSDNAGGTSLPLPALCYGALTWMQMNSLNCAIPNSIERIQERLRQLGEDLANATTQAERERIQERIDRWEEDLREAQERLQRNIDRWTDSCANNKVPLICQEKAQCQGTTYDPTRPSEQQATAICQSIANTEISRRCACDEAELECRGREEYIECTTNCLDQYGPRSGSYDSDAYAECQRGCMEGVEQCANEIDSRCGVHYRTILGAYALQVWAICPGSFFPLPTPKPNNPSGQPDPQPTPN